ncbi:helix-turn-helix domain-containing protein [Deinococcus fonticola]|uniref:helix-turn-helix domain-containing protein n=1 Tax=Deinococcus fonticola TaxID=2528713 RepID=UPI00107562F9|nr:helix-turn-helix domain-containing protein [Deinococcus fonticola]
MDEYNALTDASTAIRVQLARMGMNQADLARKLGILPGTVSRALAGSPMDERSKTWPAILDALGLEVIIRPKS